MKILVGFDDSEGAWDAIALARTLCAVTGAKAFLVQVVSEEVDSLDVAREALAGIEVSTRSCTGNSPAHVLHDLAESEGAEAVVIGSPHRGALGRTFLGSVGEGLLHGATRPLVVAPRDYAAQAHEALRVVAVAYDGTTESKSALEHAEGLAAAAGATIRVLTVLPPAVPMPQTFGQPPQLDFEPETLIEEAVAAVNSVTAEGRQLTGPVAAALAEACEEGVDLLVAGSRGYGPLGRVFAGSVTSSLICMTPCPVLIVPRSQDPDPRQASKHSEALVEQEGVGGG